MPIMRKMNLINVHFWTYPPLRAPENHLFTLFRNFKKSRALRAPKNYLFTLCRKFNEYVLDGFFPRRERDGENRKRTMTECVLFK